jgi:hypothetical protein
MDSSRDIPNEFEALIVFAILILLMMTGLTPQGHAFRYLLHPCYEKGNPDPEDKVRIPFQFSLPASDTAGGCRTISC